MKGDKKEIEFLNKILSNELVAINQYFLHSRMFNNWGYTQIGAKVFKESIDEMKHADLLIDRILFLNGMPNMHSLEKLKIGKTIPDMFQSDLDLEFKATADLRDAIAYIETIKDYKTREMLEGILAQEEDHIDWLETQISLYNDMGSQNYIQSVV